MKIAKIINLKNNQEFIESTYVLKNEIQIKKDFNKKSDHEIWSAFKEGDENAFNYIYKVYTGMLCNYGYQFTKRKDLIRDVVQNLFIDLRKNRQTLAKVVCIKAFLFKWFYRALLKKLKKEQKYIFNTELIEKQGFKIEISQETKIIREEMSSELKASLQAAVDKLTDRQRHIIILFFEEGLSYKDISVIMDFKDVKSARKLVYRAITAIKKEMNGIF